MKFYYDYRYIIEGKMKGKACRVRKGLHGSAKYPKVKRAAEDSEGWRTTNRTGMP